MFVVLQIPRGPQARSVITAYMYILVFYIMLTALACSLELTSSHFLSAQCFVAYSLIRFRTDFFSSPWRLNSFIMLKLPHVHSSSSRSLYHPAMTRSIEVHALCLRAVITWGSSISEKTSEVDSVTGVGIIL